MYVVCVTIRVREHNVPEFIQATFEFSTTPAIVFGTGTLEQLGERAARFGRRAWLVTGAKALERAGVLHRVTALLAARGVTATRQRVDGEPDTAIVDHGTRTALE